MEFKDNETTYRNEYNRQKYDRIGLMIPKGQGDVWKAEAKQRGMSLNAFVMQAVTEYMEKNTTDRSEGNE